MADPFPKSSTRLHFDMADSIDAPESNTKECLSMSHDNHISFSINEVAKMLGVVPATIRNWEKSGLITAKRTPNNYRVFAPEDIEILKKIKEYSIDKHMGIHAIKMLLPSSNDADLENYIEQRKESYFSKKMMSEKWRDIRKQKGYTLEEISQATGISVAHLSNLEHGGNISLDLMNKLAHFYGENPLHFMQSASLENHLVRKGCGDPIKLKNDPSLEMLALVGLQDPVMIPVLCTVEPGCGNLTPHAHNGEELVYVLSGTFEYRLNDNPPFVLHAGDSFHHRGSDMHSWQNISNKPAKLLWVHSTFPK